MLRTVLWFLVIVLAVMMLADVRGRGPLWGVTAVVILAVAIHIEEPYDDKRRRR